MLRVYVWLTDPARSESGQDVIEYALISALISVSIIGVILATGLVGAFGVWAVDLKECLTKPGIGHCVRLAH